MHRLQPSPLLGLHQSHPSTCFCPAAALCQQMVAAQAAAQPGSRAAGQPGSRAAQQDQAILHCCVAWRRQPFVDGFVRRGDLSSGKKFSSFVETVAKLTSNHRWRSSPSSGPREEAARAAAVATRRALPDLRLLTCSCHQPRWSVRRAAERPGLRALRRHDLAAAAAAATGHAEPNLGGRVLAARRLHYPAGGLRSRARGS